MRWTWDSDKDRENRRKHQVRFETAQLVFSDPFMLMQEDDFPHEQRWRTLGSIDKELFLVIHTWPETNEQIGRIISARRATPHERRAYEES